LQMESGSVRDADLNSKKHGLKVID